MAELTMRQQQAIVVESSASPVAYPDAVARMDQLAEALWQGEGQELLWLLEHPALYTSGTSARAADFTQPPAIPVFRTRRGGQITYHGPGQRIAYILLDLRTRRLSVRDYVASLETWLIDTLAILGVNAERRCGRVGAWVPGVDGTEAKIAAIGVAVRHGIAMHGVALNVEPDLAAYNAIIPCGIKDFGVTSLASLGQPATMAQVDKALLSAWPGNLGTLSVAAGAPC